MSEETEFEILDACDKTLGVPLTLTEISKKASEAAGLFERHTDGEEERKRIDKSTKQGLAEIDAEARGLMREVRRGEEMRAVECEVRLYTTSNAVRTVRLDTGEILDERAATGRDLQITMGLDDPSQAAAEQGDEAETETNEADAEQDPVAAIVTLIATRGLSTKATPSEVSKDLGMPVTREHIRVAAIVTLIATRGLSTKATPSEVSKDLGMPVTREHIREARRQIKATRQAEE